MKVQSVNNPSGRYLYQCPGCGDCHFFDTKGNGPKWTFNGDVDKPTVSPSVRVRSGKRVCHFFIKNGMIEFCSDSTHELAGKTVELPDWED